MKSKFRHMLLLTVSAGILLPTACNKTILEFPDETGGIDPSLVHFNLTLEVDPGIEPYVAAKAGEEDGSAGNGGFDVRWQIEVYRDGIEGEPVYDRLLTCDPAADGNHSQNVSFDLKAARYTIVAWADYVDDSSTADKYYDTSDLSHIRIPDAGSYIGSEDHKDTYVAVEEVDLTAYFDRWYASVERTMTLTRPMAKIQFVTVDIQRMLANLEAMRQNAGTEPQSISDKLLSGDPQLNTIRTTVEYAGYLPSSFNAYTGKPNDAVQGVSFTSNLTQLSDDEAHLGSDFIFVNGSESAVTVNLVITDDEGNLINRVDGINVPIKRGKLTTIRDEFLTKDYSPGIGIDPGFDGDINIVIPD